MTNSNHMERKKAFKTLRTYLRGNGLKKGLNRSEIILYICNRYTPDFAQKVLDLWFGEDLSRTKSIYYKQDLAYNIDCEELTDRLKNPNEVFRKDVDTPFIYREKFNIKKVLFSVLKTFFTSSSIHTATTISLESSSKKKRSKPIKKLTVNYIADNLNIPNKDVVNYMYKSNMGFNQPIDEDSKIEYTLAVGLMRRMKSDKSSYSNKEQKVYENSNAMQKNKSMSLPEYKNETDNRFKPTSKINSVIVATLENNIIEFLQQYNIVIHAKDIHLNTKKISDFKEYSKIHGGLNLSYYEASWISRMIKDAEIIFLNTDDNTVNFISAKKGNASDTTIYYKVVINTKFIHKKLGKVSIVKTVREVKKYNLKHKKYQLISGKFKSN